LFRLISKGIQSRALKRKFRTLKSNNNKIRENNKNKQIEIPTDF